MYLQHSETRYFCFGDGSFTKRKRYYETRHTGWRDSAWGAKERTDVRHTRALGNGAARSRAPHTIQKYIDRFRFRHKTTTKVPTKQPRVVDHDSVLPSAWERRKVKKPKPQNNPRKHKHSFYFHCCLVVYSLS